MKQFKQQLGFVVIGFTALLVSTGCLSQIVSNEMTRRNEVELKKGQITPAQYRQQRDEIDRNLK